MKRTSKHNACEYFVLGCHRCSSGVRVANVVVNVFSKFRDGTVILQHDGFVYVKNIHRMAIFRSHG